MKTIENKEDYKKLIDQKTPILLDFYADWCGPCQTLLPIVSKLAEEYEGKIEIQKVNVDQNRELALQYGVRSIPALFFIKNDKVIDRSTGIVPETQLRTQLDKMLA